MLNGMRVVYPLRAATIMGIDGNGLRALSRSLDDVAENVSPPNGCGATGS